MRAILITFILTTSLVVIAQNETTSLGDVARQSRNHSVTAKKVWNDENDEVGRTAADASSPCGAPVTTIPIGSISALLGKDLPPGDPVAKSLLRWLEKHPDLDSMSTDELAKLSFPRSPDQAQANGAMASQEVARWIAQIQEAKDGGSPDQVNSVVTDIMNTRNAAGPASMVATVIDKEKDRRARSDGSQSDKVAEAVNLYTICENRRMAQTLDEVDTLAKADFRKRIAEAVKQAQSQGNALQ